MRKLFHKKFEYLFWKEVGRRSHQPFQKGLITQISLMSNVIDRLNVILLKDSGVNKCGSFRVSFHLLAEKQEENVQLMAGK